MMEPAAARRDADLRRALDGFLAAIRSPQATGRWQAHADLLYPRTSGLTPNDILADLRRRGEAAALSGAIGGEELRAWVHHHGLLAGYPWPAVQLTARLGLKRHRLGAALDRVSAVVAATFRDDGTPVGRPEVHHEEAAALALARALAEERRHAAEFQLLSLTTAPRPSGRPSGSLKTSRHRALFDRSVGAAAAEIAAATRGMSPRLAVPELAPLWTPLPGAAVDTAADPEVVLRGLRGVRTGWDRENAWLLLGQARRLLARGGMDREIAIELLLHDVTMMREHENITGLVALNLLEVLLPPSSPRRVDIARERAHLLQIHHRYDAARVWLERAHARADHPATAWPGADAHAIAVARNIERDIECRLQQIALGPPGADRSGHRIEQRLERIDRMLVRVEDRALVAEWEHVAQRRRFERMLWDAVADRVTGRPVRWADDELAGLDEMDARVVALGMPMRETAWSTRRLAILLEADRPREFTRSLAAVVRQQQTGRGTFPNLLSRVADLVTAARRRRSRAWRAVEADLGDLARLLPATTDGGLRDFRALPGVVRAGRIPVT